MSQVRSACYDADESGWLQIKWVWNCSFHPSKPKLACSLMNGKIAVFIGKDRSTPFSRWSRVTWRAESTSEVTKIDWNVDGSKLAGGCGDGTVVCWDQDGGKRFERKVHESEVLNVCWNKEDPNLVATGSWDKSVIVWNVQSENWLQIFKCHSRPVRDLCWLTSHLLASCSYDGTVQVHQLGQHRPFRIFHNQVP